MNPEIVELGNGNQRRTICLFHDEQAPEPSLAYLLSRMTYPGNAGTNRGIPARRSAGVR